MNSAAAGGYCQACVMPLQSLSAESREDCRFYPQILLRSPFSSPVKKRGCTFMRLIQTARPSFGWTLK
jgi:hypothetical protein